MKPESLAAYTFPGGPDLEGRLGAHMKIIRYLDTTDARATASEQAESRRLRSKATSSISYKVTKEQSAEVARLLAPIVPGRSSASA